MRRELMIVVGGHQPVDPCEGFFCPLHSVKLSISLQPYLPILPQFSQWTHISQQLNSGVHQIGSGTEIIKCRF